jgi:hypothetical protein
MNLSNFALVEAIWTGLNLATFLVAAYLLREAELDRRAVIESGENGLFRLTVDGDRRRLALKLLMAFAFLVAGLYAGLFIPANPEAPSEPPLAAYITILCLMVADLALLLLVLEGARQRHQMSEYLRNMEAPEPTAQQAEDKEYGDRRRLRDTVLDEELTEEGGSP